MKTILRSLVVSLLLALFSNTTLAQTVQSCPSGQICTVYIMMNGVQGTTAANWKAQVTAYGNSYLAARNLPLDSPYVKFDSVFNHGGYLIGDLAEATVQWIAQAIKVVLPNDPDFIALIDRIRLYSANGYRVVLVGHSQGTFYTNFAYETIRDHVILIPTIPTLPDPTKLSIVNIASAADHVADGNGRYTTQCGDVMYVVPGSLPSNINNDGPASCSPGLGVHPVDLHLLDAYLAAGSKTQKQVYADFDLAASLPDPGCTGDINCYLKDNFSAIDSVNNFAQTFLENPISADGSTIQELSGTLRLTSYNNYTPGLTGPGMAPVPARLSVRSRRVFRGQFSVNTQYNSYGNPYGNNGTNSITLVNSVTNAVAAYWTLAPISVNTTWYPLNFTRTGTQISLFVDGVSYGSFPSNSTDGYYLMFDLKGNNTLQIRNLSVTLPTGTVAITANVPTQCSLNGVNITAPATLTNQYIGTKTLTCVAPAGYTLNSVTPPSQTLSAGGTANFAVSLTAIPQGNITWTPPSTTLNVTQGGSGYVDLVLKSVGGLSGNANLSLNCTTCGPSFSYNFPTSVALSANGSATVRMTLTDHGNAVGTYSYQYKARLGATGIATANITVKVIALPPMTVSCAFAWSPAVVGEANYVTASQVGGVPPVAFTLNNYNVTGPLTIFANSVGTLSATVKGTDNIGRVATNTCSIPAIATPTPVLSSLSVASMRKGVTTRVTLTGSGFIHGSQVRYCDSPAFGTNCPGATVTYVNGNQLVLPGIVWYFPGTLYFKVVNPGNLSSGIKTMTVTN